MVGKPSYYIRELVALHFDGSQLSATHIAHLSLQYRHKRTLQLMKLIWDHSNTNLHIVRVNIIYAIEVYLITRFESTDREVAVS